MLINIKLIENYKVMATDGDIGSISDFYFDDEHWALRYLIVDTGGLLTTWRVLISPMAFGHMDVHNQKFHLSLTREKVKNSPSIDLRNPISRQYEQLYHDYYGWPFYWGGAGVWGGEAYPRNLAKINPNGDKYLKEIASDSHLRSFNEIDGYSIRATDGEIGHIDNLIIDDETWSIRYLVVDTKNWWFGKKVLVSPQWAEKISWDENKIYLNLTRDSIKNSPEWDEDLPIDREYENLLHEHYKQTNYWDIK